MLARELEDGTLELIDGHARTKLADEAEVPVLVLDVDEAEADVILATFDPLSAMASEQSGELDDLLSSMADDESLASLLTSIHTDFKIEDIPDEGNFEEVLAPEQKVLVLKYSPADYEKLEEALDR